MPATMVYAALLVGTGAWAARLPGEVHEVTLRAVSTNVGNLSRGRVDTLLTSAVFLAPPRVPHFLTTVPLVAVGELSIGTRRTVAAFAVGHVGASTVVGVLLAAGAFPGVASGQLRDAVDVGPSYGAIAVTAALAVLRARRRSTWWGALPVTATLSSFAVARTFTEAGHVSSALIGSALGAAWRAADRHMS